MAHLFVVDDESSIRSALAQVFEYEGHEVQTAEDGQSALDRFEEVDPDVTFLDVKMPGMDGLEVLDRIRELDPMAVVIMISGHGTIDTAVEATRSGAFDFLEKPLDTDRLLVTLRNALEVRGLSESVRRLRSEVESRHEIVGSSPAVQRVLERIERVAPTDARVLITGENGTGKELVARAIHRLSDRPPEKFIEVNCAAIPSELIESELFGHIKGSFTGAVADRAGKFEQASGGTLFLDEIGDMSLAAQAKVLRALEEGVITRVGGSKAIRVDVRVIAATNKDLEAEIEEGGFREDLFYRLNVVPIRVPPLRERRDDIPMLVTHFTELTARTAAVPARPFDDEAINRLQSMEWPGNVRELRNTVERLLILSPGESVRAADVALLVSGARSDGALGGDLLSIENFSEFKDRAEELYIRHKLDAYDWNVSETARQMDMPRNGPENHLGRAFSVRRGNLLIITLDTFEDAGDHFDYTVGPEQLAWLEETLKANQDAEFIIAQGHLPVVGPVRSKNSSASMLVDGTDSPLWKLMVEYGVDVYLCGEHHRITVKKRDGIWQIVHGALWGTQTDVNYLRGEATGDALTLELLEFDVEYDGGYIGDHPHRGPKNKPRENVRISEDTLENGPRVTGRLVLSKNANGAVEASEATGWFDLK